MNILIAFNLKFGTFIANISSMKSIFTIMICLASMSVFSQRLQNGSYSTIGYIDKDGRVQNSSYSTIGYFGDDGRVENSSYSTIGYVKDGRVQNGSYSTIGYVKGGRVENSSYSTIGYYDESIPVEWVAGFFFFFFND